jgi:hypothetical protein
VSPERIRLHGTNTDGKISPKPGMAVVRCNRLDAADAVGEFEGKRTTATVTLTIMGDSGSEVITVRK